MMKANVLATSAGPSRRRATSMCCYSTDRHHHTQEPGYQISSHPRASTSALVRHRQLASLADERRRADRSWWPERFRRPWVVSFTGPKRCIQRSHADDGINIDGRQIRKGAASAVRAYVESMGSVFPRRSQNR